MMSHVILSALGFTPIITYEIGYTTHQSNDSYSPSDEFSPMIKTNTSSRNVNISGSNMYDLFLFL